MPRFRTLAVASLIASLSACTSIPLHAPSTPSKPDPFPAPAPAPAVEQPPLSVPDTYDPDFEPPAEATDPGFGQPPFPPAAPLHGYTAGEKKIMTACRAIANSSLYAAERRKAGKPLDSAIALYAGHPLYIAMVRKVYADDIDDVWVYAADMFRQCTTSQTGMAAERLGLASQCMRRQLVGGRALELKSRRRSKSYVLNYFRRLGQPVDDEVDLAWASSEQGAQFKLRLWNDCLGPDAY